MKMKAFIFWKLRPKSSKSSPDRWKWKFENLIFFIMKKIPWALKSVTVICKKYTYLQEELHDHQKIAWSWVWKFI